MDTKPWSSPKGSITGFYDSEKVGTPKLRKTLSDSNIFKTLIIAFLFSSGDFFSQSFLAEILVMVSVLVAFLITVVKHLTEVAQGRKLCFDLWFHKGFGSSWQRRHENG